MKLVVLFILLFTTACRSQNIPKELVELLVRNEQDLVNAIAAGDKSVWKKHLHDSCLITIEDGTTISAEKLIETMKPLPAGYTGKIIITEPRLALYGNTVVLNFIDDEYLELYNQKIHTQYRQTDTWVKIDGQWKIVAMQIFEIPKNPPPALLPNPQFSQFTGTYKLGEDKRCVVSLDNGRLYAKKGSRESEELFPETENVFFRKNDTRVRVIFMKNSDDRFKLIERRAGEDLVWSKEETTTRDPVSTFPTKKR